MKTKLYGRVGQHYAQHKYWRGKDQDGWMYGGWLYVVWWGISYDCYSCLAQLWLQLIWLTSIYGGCLASLSLADPDHSLRWLVGWSWLTIDLMLLGIIIIMRGYQPAAEAVVSSAGRAWLYIMALDARGENIFRWPPLPSHHILPNIRFKGPINTNSQHQELCH